VAFDYGTLARFARANAELAPPGRKERRVVFFGDSITDNWSAPGYGGFFPGRPYVNRGIGGQTTSQMLLRFRADVVALRPRAVVILAGTNDIGGNGGPIALGAVQDNLAAMTEQARSAGIRVVLATLLPVSDDKSDEGGAPLLWTRDHPAETISALNRWIAEHARAHRHVVLDYFKATVDGRGLLRPDLTDDGLHPNAAGYAVMAPLAEHSIDRVLR
jgi:lysophospholipase L1-like esterase